MSTSIIHFIDFIDNTKVVTIIAPVDFSAIWYQKFSHIYINEKVIGSRFIIDFMNTKSFSHSALGMLLLLKDHLNLIEGELTLKNVRFQEPLGLLPTSNSSIPRGGAHRNHIGTLKQHGSYEISSNNQVLTMKAYNEWNIETTLSCCKAFKAEVHKISHKGWSCLVDLSDWDMGPIEMIKEIHALNIWSEKNNQKFEAVIVKNSLQKHILEKSQTVFTAVRSDFFGNESNALRWLSRAQMTT